MKRTINIIFLITTAFIFSCSKKGDNNPSGGNQPKTVGNTTTYSNGYVVKSLGISRIRVSLDANNKIVLAELYGGGNRIILKSGSGNTMSLLAQTDPMIADDNLRYYPDAYYQPDDAVIDNGKLLDTSGNYLTVKIKGFSRENTGYDQLNFVMCKEVIVRGIPSPAFPVNFTYLKMTRAAGKKNAAYDGNFIKSVFSGNISVNDVEIAAPASANPYLTRDDIISIGNVAYDPIQKETFNVNAVSTYFKAGFGLNTTGNAHLGTNIKAELVNADKMTITQDVTKTYYTVTFPNIKQGDLDQVVFPSDTTNRVYIRITGLDPSVCGYNQYRLFFTNDGSYSPYLAISYGVVPNFTVNEAAVRQSFSANPVVGYYLYSVVGP